MQTRLLPGLFVCTVFSDAPRRQPDDHGPREQNEPPFRCRRRCLAAWHQRPGQMWCSWPCDNGTAHSPSFLGVEWAQELKGAREGALDYQQRDSLPTTISSVIGSHQLGSSIDKKSAADSRLISCQLALRLKSVTSTGFVPLRGRCGGKSFNVCRECPDR